MIKSMAASSLVELSTSGKQPVPLSLSRQPLTGSAPLGRVTHSREKAHGITKEPSPSVDTTPSPAEKDPVAIQPPPTDLPAKKTTAKSMGTHSTSPAKQGKTKLQFCIDHKVAHLEE